MNAPSFTDLLLDAGGSTATITINRPDQRNALSLGTMSELRSAFAWCKERSDVHVVVLTGAGDRVFCAGADLGGFGGASTLELHDGRHALVDLFIEMSELGKPIVGRINGHALGRIWPGMRVRSAGGRRFCDVRDTRDQRRGVADDDPGDPDPEVAAQRRPPDGHAGRTLDGAAAAATRTRQSGGPAATAGRGDRGADRHAWREIKRDHATGTGF